MVENLYYKCFRDVNASQNVMIMDELRYDREELRNAHDIDFVKLTDEQKKIYEEIMDAVLEKKEEFSLFMDLVEQEKRSCGGYYLLLLDQGERLF